MRARMLFTNNLPHPLRLLFVLLISIQIVLIHSFEADEVLLNAVNGRNGREFVVRINSSDLLRNWRDILLLDSSLVLERSITNKTCQAEHELSKRQGTCSPGSRAFNLMASAAPH
jgi:hypothetical protein